MELNFMTFHPATRWREVRKIHVKICRAGSGDRANPSKFIPRIYRLKKYWFYDFVPPSGRRNNKKRMQITFPFSDHEKCQSKFILFSKQMLILKNISLGAILS